MVAIRIFHGDSLRAFYKFKEFLGNVELGRIGEGDAAWIEDDEGLFPPAQVEVESWVVVVEMVLF